MKKKLPSFNFAKGTINRFGRSRLGNSIRTLNSNAQVLKPGEFNPRRQSVTPSFTKENLGLNSARLRAMMRSEERRVGKECRCWGRPGYSEEKSSCMPKM